MIYLDNSATTRPFDKVTELVAEMEHNLFGNPSSLHHAGVLAERRLTEARQEALSALGDPDGSFIFTAGGTEANNLAILGTMMSRLRRTPQIITSKIEHPSVLETILHLKELGADCRFVSVDSKGIVDPEEFNSLLSENTALVSIMSVNNETGSIEPISELVKLAKSKNPRVLFHTDAVQALGKIPLNASRLGVDMISVSSHKINGPKGVGGLYVKRGTPIKPILFGGGQEKGLRSGTHNNPAICGFSLALSETMAHLKETTERMNHLRLKLMAGLNEIKGCRVITEKEAAPHILCAAFPGLKSETLLHALERREIYVSSGSACSSNKPQLSPTLLAMGYQKKEIDGALRFSLGYDTKEEDIEKTLQAVREEASFLLTL